LNKFKIFTDQRSNMQVTRQKELKPFVFLCSLN
jgi:hypothetical protein